MAALEQTAADELVDASAQPADDLAAFLNTLAVMLRETVAKFEKTASKVTDLVETQPGTTDRELVVALQDFDRLQQEFAAITEALAKTGASMKGRWHHEDDDEDHPKDKVIGGISIADLRERMLQHLNSPSIDPAVEPTVDALLEEPIEAADADVAEF